jgi:hypothetical protein
MGIAEAGEAILGDKLIGFQVGNEPDLYSAYVLFSVLMICYHFNRPLYSAMVIALRLTVHSIILAISLSWSMQ